MAERANIFGDSDDFDLSGFTPKQAPRTEAPAEAVRAISEAAHFVSREPAPPDRAKQPQADPAARPAAVRKDRRRRTGRNAQFNLKARPETIEAFCAIADRQGWGLGETLEYAVNLLQEKYPAKARTSAEK